MASGGLRKGSGSFYTRPALSVPLVQRTLEPLCYRRDGDRLVPHAPEVILSLKVCEPAMGSGSFLVAALRYLVEALHRSLDQHGRIQPRAEREVIVTLPFGEAARGEEAEELLPLAPEDERFTEHLRARLARHVVERCLYGVDRNPMAVELARLALWVETLDRDLPFEYLDHKLKVGNSLVGCWLHLVEDYPLRALDREGADGAKGERTKWLKRAFGEAKAQMSAVIDRIGGAMRFFDDVQLPPEDLVARVRERFEALHELRREEREPAYRELLASDEYRGLKRRMDLWCALWFWPAGDESLPLPLTWGELTPEADATVERLADEHGFFHWEVEFPDAFRPDRTGFDAVLGNPPWETLQTEPLEFFSRHDPLYRTYGNTEALARQRELFTAVDGQEDRWAAYQAGFKAMSALVKGYARPFDVPLGRGRARERLSGGWQAVRRGRPSLAHIEHPYRLQGGGKVYSYKLFLDMAHHLVHEDGRLGMLLPSGLYTDKGATELRRRLLDHCTWEWCYGFENRLSLFPIHRSFKFLPIVAQRGDSTETLNAAFMRHHVGEWEHPTEYAVPLAVSEIRRFAPETLSLMEFRGPRDLELVDRLYADHPRLGEALAAAGGRFQLEFMMNSHDRLFVRRTKLERERVLSEIDDARDPRVRARLRVAGYLPLYEGRSFFQHDPYFRGKKNTESVSKFVPVATVREELEGDAWTRPRLAFRDIASSTNQRTLIATVMPPAVHGNKAPTLDAYPCPYNLAALFSSLCLDYILRMKVSASLNWHYMATLPIPDWSSTAFAEHAPDLAHRLNAVGADFSDPAPDPLVEPADRLAVRLTLDALVADLFSLHPDDLGHITTRFPIYDRTAPGEHRYPTLAVEVFRAMHAGGPDAAERRAQELAAARGAAGVGFGLDELWQPEGGWERANREAREILGDAEAAA
ncbi:MAG: hypothetical protein MSC31_16270 [Solirubrobacteraceae bacterium MAG38_C4-C5]|nr:hypothetical protein [Candidatus Siliceabacter maunaloa]